MKNYAPIYWPLLGLAVLALIFNLSARGIVPGAARYNYTPSLEEQLLAEEEALSQTREELAQALRAYYLGQGTEGEARQLLGEVAQRRQQLEQLKAQLPEAR